MPLPVRFEAPKERKDPKRSGHLPQACPRCGLKRYQRMTRTEQVVHHQWHAANDRRG